MTGIYQRDSYNDPIITLPLLLSVKGIDMIKPENLACLPSNMNKSM